jgi:hypothetical protein
MVPFWKEAMEMVLDVEPGAPLHRRAFATATYAMRVQMKTLQKYPTCLL